MLVRSRRVISICSLAVALLMPATGIAAFTSYVRVASDGFHFLADNPAVFFVPVGVNYTAADQGWAPDYFSDCYFDEAKLQRDFAAMRALNLNVCKVNIPLIRVLPRGQGPDLITFDDTILARFEKMMEVAEANQIRLIVVVQNSWHGSPPWYLQAGGQRGQRTKHLLEETWQQLLLRRDPTDGLLYRDKKVVMSWSFAIEIAFEFHDWDSQMVPLWQDFLRQKYGTIANMEATWGFATGAGSFSEVPLPFCENPPGFECWNPNTCTQSGACYDGRNVRPFKETIPPFQLRTWRDFLEESAANECSTPGTSPRYQELLDYQRFRGRLAAEWIKVQVDAIREVDSNHLLSLGIRAFTTPLFRAESNPHPDCEPYWQDGRFNEGLADWEAFDGHELSRIVDFVDVHMYPRYPWPATQCAPGHGRWPGYPNPPTPGNELADFDEDHLEFLRMFCRFAFAGKPVILGEFGQVADAADIQNLNRINYYDRQAMYRTAGDVSGWMGWSFHNWCDGSTGSITAYNGLFADPRVGDPTGPCPGPAPVCPPGSQFFGLCATPWGLSIQALAADAQNPSGALGLGLIAQRIGRRPATITVPPPPTDSLVRGKDYLSWLGGPLGTGYPGVHLLDTTTLGSLTNPTVAEAPFPFNPDVTRLLQLDGRLAGHTIPEVMVESTPYAVSIDVRNTGTTPWLSTGPYRFEPVGLSAITVSGLVQPSIGAGQTGTVSMTLTPPGPGRYGIVFEVRDTTQSPPRRVGERMTFSIQVIPSLSIEPDVLVVGSGGGPTNAAQVKTLLHDLTSATWTTTSNFFAFDPSQDFYGAEVAVGNLDGVFPPEIIVAHGPQAVPPCGTCSPSADVSIYQKDLSSAGPPTFLGTLCPTPPFNTPRMGLSVAAGNVIPESVGRQMDELLAAPGPSPSFGSVVKVLSVDISTSCGGQTVTYAERATIALPSGYLGGASVAAADIDGDGVKEVVVGTGTENEAAVFVYKYSSGAFSLLTSSLAFPHPVTLAAPDPILGETHSLVIPRPVMAPAACSHQPIRYAASVAGGNVVPETGATPARDEIVVALGPYGPGSTSRNEGWVSVLRYDPACTCLQFVRDLAGYGPARNGLSVAAGDVNADGVQEIVSAAGPDPAAGALVNVFGVDTTRLPATVVQSLLPARTVIPFGSLFGANVALKVFPGSPTRLRPIGSPIIVGRYLEQATLEAPDTAFLDPAAQSGCVDSVCAAADAAEAGDLQACQCSLDELDAMLPTAVIDPIVRLRIGQLSTDLRLQAARASTNSPPVADPGPPLSAPADGNGLGTVTLDGSRSTDTDSLPDGSDIVYHAWSIGDDQLGVGETLDVALPAGEHDVVLTVVDSVGNESQATVHVSILDIDPPYLAVKVEPHVLWPPNQQLVEIVPTFTALDAVDPAPTISLRSVTSSEPDDGDIVITPEGRVFVRADRDGKGTGRTYTIVYTATDDSGNQSAAAAEVTVPHDQGR